MSRSRLTRPLPLLSRLSQRFLLYFGGRQNGRKSIQKRSQHWNPHHNSSKNYPCTLPFRQRTSPGLGLSCWESPDIAADGPCRLHHKELPKISLKSPRSGSSLRFSCQVVIQPGRGTYLCQHGSQNLKRKERRLECKPFCRLELRYLCSD